MSDQEKYKLEDFWPGAEELLDQHFQKKTPFWKRGGFILLSCVVLLSMATWAYFQYNSVELKTPATAEFNKLESPSQTIIQTEENQDEAKNLTPSNSEIQSKQETAQIIPHTNPAQLPAQLLTQSETATLSGTNAQKINSASNSKISPVIKSSSVSNASAEKPASSFENGPNPMSHPNLSSAPIAQVSDGQRAASESQADQGNSNEPAAPTTPEKAVEKSNPISAGSKNLPLPIKTGTPDIYTEKLLSLKSLDLNQTPATLVSPSSESTSALRPLSASEVTSQFLLKFPKYINTLEVSAGLFYTTKTLKADAFPDYVNRRTSEESASLNSSFNLAWSIHRNRWNLRAGLEYTSYGEKINYSNYLMGLNPQINYSNVITMDSIFNPVLYYVEGNQYETYVAVYNQDTLLIADTSFIAGKVDADVSYLSSKTRLSYIEVPVSFGYALIQGNRLSLSAEAGVSLGIMQERRGYYVDPTLEEFSSIQESKNFKSMVLNARAGLTLSYFVRPGLAILVRPEYRGNLNSVFVTGSGITQRYSSYGLGIGLRKTF